MKALVTGGGGFLGRYLVEQLLANGYETRTFCRRPRPELAALGVDQRLGSLDNFADVDAACEGCDVVFHVAAFPSVVMDPRPYYQTNVLGTKNVVAACLKRKVRRLVYTSTQCVANTIESQEGVDESAPYASPFLGWYQMTKAIAERFVLAANYAPWTDDYDFGGVDLSEARFRSLKTNFDIVRPNRDPNREDSLMTCALRPHLIWGPRDGHLIRRTIQRARAGKLWRVGDGSNLIATIYVENCATAHRMAAEAMTPGGPVPGGVYYISQEAPTNCWEWIDRLLEIAGEPRVRKSVSFKTAWRLGCFLERAYSLAGWKSEPMMTRFLATQLSKSYWFDTSRAARDFGFRPAISFEEGMRRWTEEIRQIYAQ
ncbi:MAG: NAD-dependent epimerase/dehydratase family protein [Thermoguttaceae bacterium]|nr:NAD-dependent epimerase/dehydratase family protein [Thermoguttaceae bacterium]